ncbi:hypothetical protein pb186bvf_007244 [Paramecium bursaria]
MRQNPQQKASQIIQRMSRERTSSFTGYQSLKNKISNHNWVIHKLYQENNKTGQKYYKIVYQRPNLYQIKKKTTILRRIQQLQQNLEQSQITNQKLTDQIQHLNHTINDLNEKNSQLNSEFMKEILKANQYKQEIDILSSQKNMQVEYYKQENLQLQEQLSRERGVNSNLQYNQVTQQHIIKMLQTLIKNESITDINDLVFQHIEYIYYLAEGYTVIRVINTSLIANDLKLEGYIRLQEQNDLMKKQEQKLNEYEQDLSQSKRLNNQFQDEIEKLQFRNKSYLHTEQELIDKESQFLQKIEHLQDQLQKYKDCQSELTTIRKCEDQQELDQILRKFKINSDNNKFQQLDAEFTKFVKTVFEFYSHLGDTQLKIFLRQQMNPDLQFNLNEINKEIIKLLQFDCLQRDLEEEEVNLQDLTDIPCQNELQVIVQKEIAPLGTNNSKVINFEEKINKKMIIIFLISAYAQSAYYQEFLSVPEYRYIQMGSVIGPQQTERFNAGNLNVNLNLSNSAQLQQSSTNFDLYIFYINSTQYQCLVKDLIIGNYTINSSVNFNILQGSFNPQAIVQINSIVLQNCNMSQNQSLNLLLYDDSLKSQNKSQYIMIIVNNNNTNQEVNVTVNGTNYTGIYGGLLRLQASYSITVEPVLSFYQLSLGLVIGMAILFVALIISLCVLNYKYQKVKEKNITLDIVKGSDLKKIE